jgi:hypothetical protein
MSELRELQKAKSALVDAEILANRLQLLCVKDSLCMEQYRRKHDV